MKVEITFLDKFSGEVELKQNGMKVDMGPGCNNVDITTTYDLIISPLGFHFGDKVAATIYNGKKKIVLKQVNNQITIKKEILNEYFGIGENERQTKGINVGQGQEQKPILN